MTAMVFRQSYMTQRPSVYTDQLLCHCVFICSNVANGWLTACDGFYDASACWLSGMKQLTIVINLHLSWYTGWSPLTMYKLCKPKSALTS